MQSAVGGLYWLYRTVGMQLDGGLESSRSGRQFESPASGLSQLKRLLPRAPDRPADRDHALEEISALLGAGAASGAASARWSDCWRGRRLDPTLRGSPLRAFYAAPAAGPLSRNGCPGVHALRPPLARSGTPSRLGTAKQERLHTSCKSSAAGRPDRWWSGMRTWRRRPKGAAARLDALGSNVLGYVLATVKDQGASPNELTP
jgi:hypothetical protein